MIRYESLTREELAARIDAHDDKWHAKARDRTRALIAAGRFTEDTSIWGQIKPVFTRLQHDKCVFCERKLAGALAGSAEHDVEHFRPKSSVKPGPYRGRKPKVSYDFPTGDHSEHGYFWLAYDPENYATACKPCNTARKSNYFPILGLRGAANADIPSLNASEQPLLLFPHGENGDDPEDYLKFVGILVMPKHTDGVAHQRARVTIDFFSLNDREELRADRFRVIQAMYLALELSQTSTNPEARANAEDAILAMISPAEPHAACARDFLALARSDGQQAWARYKEAKQYFQAPQSPGG